MHLQTFTKYPGDSRAFLTITLPKQNRFYYWLLVFLFYLSFILNLTNVNYEEDFTIE